MRKLSDGRRNGRSERIARRKRRVVGEGAEGEGNDMVDIVLIWHTLNSVPPTPADVGDVGRPRVSGGLHDVVNGVLLLGVGSGSVPGHGESGLRAVD